VQRNVDHHARARERAGHAASRDEPRADEIAADLERGEELVDRLRDPSCPDEGAEREARLRPEQRVPADGAGGERREVEERDPEESRACGREPLRDLPEAVVGDERREERNPGDQSDTREGGEPLRARADRISQGDRDESASAHEHPTAHAAFLSQAAGRRKTSTLDLRPIATVLRRCDARLP